MHFVLTIDVWNEQNKWNTCMFFSKYVDPDGADVQPYTILLPEINIFLNGFL